MNKTSTLEEQKEELDVLLRSLEIQKLRTESLRKSCEKARHALQEVCPHEELKSDSHYFPGTYTDRAETTTKYTCVFCGKLIETKTKTHSWYG